MTETFEALSLSSASCSAQVFGADRELLLSLQPLPAVQVAPKKGSKAATSWQRKVAIQVYTKPFLLQCLSLKLVLHPGFLWQLGSSCPGLAGGTKVAREQCRRAGWKVAGGETKNTFSKKQDCTSTILGPRLLQWGQNSNLVHVPLSPEALWPAEVKSGGVKHQPLGFLHVRGALRCPTLPSLDTAASPEPLHRPWVKKE